MRLLIGSLLTVLVAGCGGKDGGTDDSASAPLDCGAYSGIQDVGSSWSWDYEVDGQEADLSAEVTAISGSDVTIESSYDYSYTYVDYHQSETDAYRCDADGLWLLSMATEYDLTRDEGETQGTKDTNYDEPRLLLPLTFAVGDTWDEHVVGSVTDSGTDSTYNFDYIITATAYSAESVSVEAGDYDTMLVTEDAVGDILKWWRAKDVGIVKADDRELLSYDP